MSDFVSCDLLPELWEEILQRHWSFLETDESIQKLQEKKKLEDCLKEFLCVVPHDRKFFLPETCQVLRKTIREMDEFTAYKAIMGFEAISQYANNLFTKPWRKEFRVLKTYSGYYTHEVKSNLLDADRLLEAMGYEKTSETCLVLDGPICPDQVTNVSRDAMAAYVECQIMNNIYSGLLTLGINCSWKEIYHYREKHIGGASQAIKGLAYSLQKRSGAGAPPPPPPKETSFNSAEDFYQQPVQTEVPKCSSCAVYHMKSHNSSQMPSSSTSHHQQQYQQMPCSVHGQSNMIHQCSHGPMNLAQQQLCMSGNCGHHSQIPHSRSLDHYNDPQGVMSHRHGYDHHHHHPHHQHQSCLGNHYQHIPPSIYHQHHPQSHLYESPYDCIGGGSLGSSASYSIIPEGAVGTCPTLNTHPYNVSGNRVPLPFNISNQLNNVHYAAPLCSNCSCKPAEGYVNVIENSYASIGKGSNLIPPVVPPPRMHSTAKEMQQSSTYLPQEQLIDFDDRALLLKHEFGSNPSAKTKESKTEIIGAGGGNSGGGRRVGNSTIYAQPVVINNDNVKTSSLKEIYASSYGYAQPLPRSNRTKSTSASNKSSATLIVDPNSVNSQPSLSAKVSEDLIDNNIQLQTELNTALNNMSLHGNNPSRKKLAVMVGNERDTSDTCDSANLDDFVAVYQTTKSSPTQAVKNQDGVGSYESWNYVFQNLEKNGYSKDLGDREDLLMQSLDLNSSLKMPNSSTALSSSLDKKPRSSTTKANKSANEKIQSLERPLKVPMEKLTSSTTSMQTQTNNSNANASASTNSLGATKKILKSALKNSNKTTTIVENPSTGMSSTLNDNKNLNYINSSSSLKPLSPPITNNINFNSKSKPSSSSGSGTTAKTSSKPKQPPPVSTQVIVTKPNEWSCRFCTFLNPDTKRICDMCYRSKDFNLEASAVTHTPTCV